MIVYIGLGFVVSSSKYIDFAENTVGVEKFKFIAESGKEKVKEYLKRVYNISEVHILHNFKDIEYDTKEYIVAFFCKIFKEFIVSASLEDIPGDRQVPSEFEKLAELFNRKVERTTFVMKG